MVKKTGKYKKYLIDKTSIWVLALILSIISFVFIILINYSPSSTGPSAAEFAQNTPFFATYKVLLSIGISLVLIGLLSFSTSVSPIDIYLKNNSTYLFTNHWLTISIKIIISILGLILTLLSSIFEPESNKSFSFVDYVFILIGAFFMIGIIVQIINSVKILIQNKGDYILIDDETLAWFDDKNKFVIEIKFSEIKSYNKILEDTEKSPEIIGILFNAGLENELKLDFESMSLIPQGKFINDLISKQMSKNSINE